MGARNLAYSREGLNILISRPGQHITKQEALTTTSQTLPAPLTTHHNLSNINHNLSNITHIQRLC
jgi:hypothetical protein